MLNNPTLHMATIEPNSNDTVKVTIPTHTLKWSAGQHVFLRFIGVNGMETHPFTVASIAPDSIKKYTLVPRQMVFLIRPQTGFTRRLFNAAHSQKGHIQYKVLVDGPYGGTGADMRAFDNVMITVGGSGICWGLPIVQDLVFNDPKPSRQIELIWVIRDASE